MPFVPLFNDHFPLIGGNLICCELCPAAFHEECLEYTFDHDKSFYCISCTQRKQMHYGDIVWVKLGVYRWWPGRIVHPNSVPENVLNMNHNTGDFPIFFFGSHDYYWINRGRVYLFVEGDLDQAAKASGSNKTLKATFAKGKMRKSLWDYMNCNFNIYICLTALTEARVEYGHWITQRKELVNKTIANKPPPYQHISVRNLYSFVFEFQL